MVKYLRARESFSMPHPDPDISGKFTVTAGDVYESTSDIVRGARPMFVADDEVAAPAATPTVIRTADGPPRVVAGSRPDSASMSLKELRSALKDRGLDATGPKADLIVRLDEVLDG